MLSDVCGVNIMANSKSQVYHHLRATGKSEPPPAHYRCFFFLIILLFLVCVCGRWFLCVNACVCRGVCTVIWGVDIWMYVCVEVYMHRLEVDMWIFVYVEVNVYRWGRLHMWVYVCV